MGVDKNRDKETGFDFRFSAPTKIKPGFIWVVAAGLYLAAVAAHAQDTPAAPAGSNQPGAAPAAASAPKTVQDGVYTAEQATRGAARFKMTCGVCHGDEMQGTEFVPELVGDDFVARWENLNVSDIVSKITTTMPPDRSAMLTDAEAADVVARILEANGYPVGQEPLPGQLKALTQLRIVKKKKP